MKLFLLLALLIAVAIIIFATQNQTELTLNFLQWNFTRSVAEILAVPFIVGVFAGMALFTPLWWKKSKSVRLLKRHIHELEAAMPPAVQEESAETEQDTEEAESENEGAIEPVR
ncbi:MAG: LapA family protein [Nitrospira sp.]|nr:LapA family protein [bacterium]MBL7049464.1 LapA family protein [Nitrospira sp.]